MEGIRSGALRAPNLLADGHRTLIRQGRGISLTLRYKAATSPFRKSVPLSRSICNASQLSCGDRSRLHETQLG